MQKLQERLIEVEEVEEEQVQVLTIVEQEELQACKRVQEQDALELAHAQGIINAYNECLAEAQQLVALGLEHENRRIRLGVLLINAKEHVGHGKFKKWIETNLPFHPTTARTYMRYANAANSKELDSLECLKEYHKVLVRLGIKQPNKGHGPQLLHEFNGFAVLTKAIAGLNQKLEEVQEKEPIEDWDEDAVSQIRDLLEPIVELYEEL